MALRPEYVAWHFYNAVRRKTAELKEKEEDRKYMMALMQPEWYKKLEEREKSEVIESTKIGDLSEANMTLDKFRNIENEARKLKAKTQYTASPEPENIKPESSAWGNPISLIEE